MQTSELSYCISMVVGERTRAPMSFLITELFFADDAVITASTQENITNATVELQQVTAECGLTISFPKTKLMVAGTGIINYQLLRKNNCRS